MTVPTYLYWQEDDDDALDSEQPSKYYPILDEDFVFL